MFLSGLGAAFTLLCGFALALYGMYLLLNRIDLLEEPCRPTGASVLLAVLAVAVGFAAASFSLMCLLWLTMSHYL